MGNFIAVAGYRTVKLFIWAMPILGFIGTVLGISLAVGGFSDFLTTNVSIDQVDEVTAQLGEVASGLSFAFDTTLLGLLGGLIASVASSGVQAREERGLTWTSWVSGFWPARHRCPPRRARRRAWSPRRRRVASSTR